MAKNQKPVVNKEFWPAKDDTATFEYLYPMIESDLNEIRELSKKKQDEPLNIFKIKMLNKKLEKAKIILKNETTNEYLEFLNEENLPINSDAVLLISQYINALKEFQKKYYYSTGDLLERYEWKTKD
ncbi:hypothetical protein FACS1894110_19040 [Spirochaetia bacterium]|nr:hypothetical protein FACS1894110_19040 [Spirochaetia bacterium]